MNFNINSLLSNSLRMLNIANRAIPLIKELSPTIKTVRNRINTFRSPIAKLPALKNTIRDTPYVEKTNKKVIYQDNSLTFFR